MNMSIVTQTRKTHSLCWCEAPSLTPLEKWQPTLKSVGQNWVEEFNYFKLSHSSVYWSQKSIRLRKRETVWQSHQNSSSNSITIHVRRSSCNLTPERKILYKDWEKSSSQWSGSCHSNGDTNKWHNHISSLSLARYYPRTISATSGKVGDQILEIKILWIVVLNTIYQSVGFAVVVVAN